MRDLIEKLRAAKNGSRELDAEIFAELHPGWRRTGTSTFHFVKDDAALDDDDYSRFPDHWTTSIDAALMLVPEGWFIYALGEKVSGIIYRGDKHDHIGWFAEVQHRDGGRLQKEIGASIALALCIAALSARLATQEPGA